MGHDYELSDYDRSDLIFTKEMLLAVGDRYEAQIAADRQADAKFR
jgi:NADH-quinone oxidoreductase subunit I